MKSIHFLLPFVIFVSSCAIMPKNIVVDQSKFKFAKKVCVVIGNKESGEINTIVEQFNTIISKTGYFAFIKSHDIPKVADISSPIKISDTDDWEINFVNCDPVYAKKICGNENIDAFIVIWLVEYKTLWNGNIICVASAQMFDSKTGNELWHTYSYVDSAGLNTTDNALIVISVSGEKIDLGKSVLQSIGKQLANHLIENKKPFETTFQN